MYQTTVIVANAVASVVVFVFFFFQAEDGIRDAQESRGLGDVYKRQLLKPLPAAELSINQNRATIVLIL